jgi:hypothetical protein
MPHFAIDITTDAPLKVINGKFIGEVDNAMPQQQSAKLKFV